MTEKLKPCPFCGGKGYVICGSSFKFGFHSHAVECEKCGTVGIVKASEQEAIEAWNTRVERTTRFDRERKEKKMGDEIRELEQRIIDLLEQVRGDELICEGIRCEQCPFHQSNLAIAARGFVRELVYERGTKVIDSER